MICYFKGVEMEYCVKEISDMLVLRKLKLGKKGYFCFCSVILGYYKKLSKFCVFKCFVLLFIIN